MRFFLGAKVPDDSTTWRPDTEVSEVTEGGTQHDEEKSSFLVCMRGRAGYIHEYAKDLGMNDDEAVYPSFYLRQEAIRTVIKYVSNSEI